MSRYLHQHGFRPDQIQVVERDIRQYSYQTQKGYARVIRDSIGEYIANSEIQGMDACWLDYQGTIIGSESRCCPMQDVALLLRRMQQAAKSRFTLVVNVCCTYRKGRGVYLPIEIKNQIALGVLLQLAGASGYHIRFCREYAYGEKTPMRMIVMYLDLEPCPHSAWYWGRKLGLHHGTSYYLSLAEVCIETATTERAVRESRKAEELQALTISYESEDSQA
jgi:hypothetical protein